MRFKNMTDKLVEYSVENYQMEHDQNKEQKAEMYMHTFLEPDELTPELDPDDPIVEQLRKKYPDVQEYKMPNVWDQLKKSDF